MDFFRMSSPLLLIYVSVPLLVPMFSVYCYLVLCFEVRYCNTYSFLLVFCSIFCYLRLSLLPKNFFSLLRVINPGLIGIASNLHVALGGMGINNICIRSAHKYMFPWKQKSGVGCPRAGVERDYELPL